ncbi:putative galacturonosyltransferase 10 [Raphanus sativus]|nr:putative galacturonosyltransferase 10 [Raphanus sativus]
MAVLRYQAQPLHYDSATMIMRLKATIQSFEGHMNSVTEKSAKYAQIAYEEVPKSLYCLGVHLTTEWFQNSELQEKLINIFIDLMVDTRFYKLYKWFMNGFINPYK